MKILVIVTALLMCISCSKESGGTCECVVVTKDIHAIPLGCTTCYTVEVTSRYMERDDNSCDAYSKKSRPSSSKSTETTCHFVGDN